MVSAHSEITVRCDLWASRYPPCVSSEATRWTIIQGAAAGRRADRDAFVRRYAPVIRAYLTARWGRSPLAAEIDDAMQEVFLDCFKDDGALGRVDPEHGSGFRAFLYGVTRNVAARLERSRARRRERQPATDSGLERLGAEDEPLSQAFDRAWCRALVREAAGLQLQRAAGKGERAVLRHRLLAARYGDGLPIREIAARWEEEPAFLHGQFRQAREEFRQALRDTVKALHGGGREAVDAECERLMQVFG